MKSHFLIDAVVQQITVLLAQLATSGGVRAPVAHIANQVFVQLAQELESQGVSRKVSADMFGMALRAYQRKLRRLAEAESDPGSTLWSSVLQFLRQDSLVTRRALLAQFSRDEERQVLSVVRDLVESNLVFRSGTAGATAYRAATDEEWGELSRLAKDDGLEEWLWVLIYREGPCREEQLSDKLARSVSDLQPALLRLQSEGRASCSPTGTWTAQEFVLPLGSPRGWEAAVFDHLQAVVQTICQRLRVAESGAEDKGDVGGSTYGFDVWEGHPLRSEVSSLLGDFRGRCGELRARVDQYNQEHELPANFQEIVAYSGQCTLERERPNQAELESESDEANE